MTSLDAFFTQVDTNKDIYIKRLSDAVAIPSVSSEVSRRPDVVKMAQFMITELENLGASVETRDPGKHVMDGKELDLPPIILATYPASSSIKENKTVLVYGHYDVQPAYKEDGWATDPFILTHDDKDRLLGRGSSDDKGPILGWLAVIQAHKDAGIPFPVTLKMCFEGMEESGSEGLDPIINDEASKYFNDVDCVCISDNYWLGTGHPCITYGLRGVMYFTLEVKGPGADLHSGVFGGGVHEPMTDLIKLMGSLVDSNGKILIPNLLDTVAPVTKDEGKVYDQINFTMDEYWSAIGSKTSFFDNTKDTLMHRWRFPSLSLHGIEGAFSTPGAKTVIPAKVIGKFSIRIVPDMEPDEVTALVKKYIHSEFSKYGSKNSVNVDMLHAGKWWVASPDHWNYRAARKAVTKVFNVEPDLTREGGSIPVTLTFQDALQKNVLLLPMGRGDDGAHSINEKLDLNNMIEGIKLLGTYLHEVAETKDS